MPQYVALCSGDHTILDQVNYIRQNKDPLRQWEESDFVAIAEAFDTLFMETKWRAE